MASQVALPDKLFFKIGEVSSLTGVKQHVLRYWESEFSAIRPQKSKSNQRLYRRRDVEAVLAIKDLLHNRKFTIEGARKHLKTEGIDASIPQPDPQMLLERAREEALRQLNDELEHSKAVMTRQFERRLLALRQQLTDFLVEIDSEH